jgi:hypothetical protein
MVTILRNRVMALSFSKSLKEGIIGEWLRGKNRDTIAHENGLSTGTVINIVKEWKEEIGGLSADQLREFAVTLRNVGISPLQCGQGFRILNILRDLGFSEDNIEMFALDVCKMCKNIGLQPDKIALHIKELIDLTEKVPLDQLSGHIERNKIMLEESDEELRNAKLQLKDTCAELDNAFSKYTSNSNISETRWTYWLKGELADRGLEFDSVPALVNTIEDIHTLGFDAKKIISKVSEIDDLETRKNALKVEITKLQKEQASQAIKLEMLKQNSSTHIQAISIYEQLASMGLGFGELTILVNTITELARENGISESMAVNKFLDDVTQQYKYVSGFESRLEELKNETEDTESDLIILRQSGSELDTVTDSLRRLWAMGVKSEDIIYLAKALDKETTNNVNYDSRTINNNNEIPSDLKRYLNLKADIEDLSKAKDELTAEMASLISIRQCLAASILSSTFRVFQYLNFMIDVIQCTRVQIQVHVLHLHLYLLYHEPPIMYNKEQELNIDKISIQSDSYQKFLPFIDAANGDDIEFRKLKNVLIDAIQIGLDKLKSSNSQDGDKDNTTTTSTTTAIIALNQAKTALEQFQEQV